MFGFGRRAQLKKLGNELKGASLREVVERFADAQFLKPPTIKFDRNIARIFSENISNEQQNSAEILLERFRAITAEHKLEQGSHNIYMAQSTFDALRTYALDLTLATKALKKDEAVKYLFTTWLKVPPEYYIIPILFPARAGDKIEDFSIDRDVRYLMIDGLFERLNSVDGFKNIVNNFAIEHPYFRNYPL